MKIKSIIIVVAILVLTSCKSDKSFNWQEFISQQDLVIDTLTPNWDDGVFTGNGLMGTMVYLNEDSAGIRIEIGRTDVVDHRPEFGLQYGLFRLPIGRFVITPNDKLVRATGKINLYDAQVEGSIKTESNNIDFKVLTHTLYDVHIIEIDALEGFSFDFRPEKSQSTRIYVQNKWTGFAPEGYTPNPDPTMIEKDGIKYCYQPLLGGGSYTTAWKEVKQNGKTYFYISMGNTHPHDGSVREAKNNIELTSSIPLSELISSHQEWWHEYYTKSYVNLPDKQFEQFWWIQQYKLGSATRSDCPAIDNMGPWFRTTPWAAYWLNLNVQLSYSPLYSSNRLDIAESLIKFINKNRHNLINNCPEEYRHNSSVIGRNCSFEMKCPINLKNPSGWPRGEPDSETGALPWLLHNYYMHCKYSMDDSLLLNDLYPLLTRSMNFYINIMEEDENGILHLPRTYSPEYPDGFTRDCNFDLALFNWGVTTLLDINNKYQLNDKLAPTWQKVLDNLTDYPKNENGMMIGADIPFEQSHRHFSHIMMWWPLHNIEPNKENTDLILKTIEHWHSFKGALEGYSFTGGASMYSKMGNGNKSYELLKTFMNDFMRPNTMYLEAGPVIETPLSAVTSINEMLIQSWKDTIRVFPALPESWTDLSFENLRTEGAFLVSAVQKNGKTESIKIKSLAGEKCLVKTDIKNYSVIGIPSEKVIKEGNILNIKIEKDEEVILSAN